MALSDVRAALHDIAKSGRGAQRAVGETGAHAAVLFLFYGAGIVLRAFYNHGGDPLASHAIEKADQILPFFVVTELAHGFPGILVAAVFGASMSVASAGLNSLACKTDVTTMALNKALGQCWIFKW